MSSAEESKNEEKSRTSKSAESSRASADSPAISSQRKAVPNQNQSVPLDSDSTDSFTAPKPMSIDPNDKSEIPNINSQESQTKPKSSSGPLKSFSIIKEASSKEEEGGEWDLLSGNIKNWLQKKDFQALLRNLVKPLLISIGITILILLLLIYGNILNVIAKFPLAPRLFELTGIIWLIYFSTTRLARNQDRKELVEAILSRWESFLGQTESKD
ncbi:CAAD domain-containing protein [Prochlorococcus sp. MIT 1300]|uniref:CAAD domain-containing protein n=1 Tax=Prochlorococcus sp. MIT 1300 TaxID=3096218 RepID=UPI002A761F04|nr:CAAD domain-containing protein [Prochlorococcus sp. MIT 1300]